VLTALYLFIGWFEFMLVQAPLAATSFIFMGWGSFGSVCVYGPAQHDRSAYFIDELSNICQGCVLPLVIDGDFNLIREPSDKSSPFCDQSLMDLFNKFIGDHNYFFFL